MLPTWSNVKSLSQEILRVIFTNLVDKGSSFTIRLRNNQESDKPFKVIEYDDEKELAVIENKDSTEMISLLDVESIEFDTFHHYKSIEAKIFLLD
jgi:hypothetical protein